MAVRKAYLSAETSNSIHLACEALHKPNQAAQRDSRGTFGDPRFLIFHPGCACNVEMNPWSIFGKLFQEHGCINGSAPTPAGVNDVGDGGLDVFFIFVI